MDHARKQAGQELGQLVDALRLAGTTSAAPAQPIPLILLSGFLGAGKTTLVNRLLAEEHGRRIVVIVNDFGGINIDRALIAAEGESSIELKNGCACCDLAGDLTRSLIGILNRAERPDAIVLEASGIADPRGIAQVALANPALRLDNIVTLVDAETVIGQLADERIGPTILAQVTAADMIVQNKTDRIPPDRQAQVRDRLLEAAPGKAVVPAAYADVPAALILGIAHRHLETESALQGRHPFESWSASTPQLLSAPDFRAFVARQPAGVLRAKGVLWMSDHPDRRTVYQQVGKRWRFSRAGGWAGAAPQSELVFIGLKGELDAARLEREFNECILDSARKDNRVGHDAEK